ncbi:MAG TPA: LssY C-terminal domain-containing protein [Phycisphaerae bacterium]|nr:LssY C-terminal domain-containing protein [Phycisphaerae bacterium]
MSTNGPDSHGTTERPRRRGPRAVLAGGLTVLGLYLLVAYLILPWTWRRYERRHPALANAPTLTHTADGIPGDPLNLALIGTEESLHRAILAAGWYPADPITLKTSLRIAADVVFKRPFDQAPVSSLFLFGRKEDLAFEKPVGTNPRERHHVRFWRSSEVDDAGRPLWFGAATFDTHVGFSHTTGQITHHIAPDVDADRDLLIDDLAHKGMLADVEWIEDFHTVRQGKNGGGDPWHTDGRLAVGIIAAKAESPLTTSAAE